MATDEILCSIRSIVEYLEENERRKYEACDDTKQKYHIYNDVVTVKEWLDEG